MPNACSDSARVSSSCMKPCGWDSCNGDAIPARMRSRCVWDDEDRKYSASWGCGCRPGRDVIESAGREFNPGAQLCRSASRQGALVLSRCHRSDPSFSFGLSFAYLPIIIPYPCCHRILKASTEAQRRANLAAASLVRQHGRGQSYRNVHHEDGLHPILNEGLAAGQPYSAYLARRQNYSHPCLCVYLADVRPP